MKKESDIIIALCGVFKDHYIPLTRSAFWKMFHRHNDSMESLANSSDENVEKLLERSASMTFAIEELQQKGVRIVTFLDEEFPRRLVEKLGDFCPPILYMSGDYRIKDAKFAGYVGSRSISEQDVKWTERSVSANLKAGYGIVTGGAKGIDSVSLNYCLSQGGAAVAFLPEDINKRILEPGSRSAILDRRLLIYSHTSPYAAKGRSSFVAAAMERNKFIYALSAATAVVRADYNKGGTWTGATEALRHGWAQVCAWDNKEYEGNQQLIIRGAIPLSDDGRRAEPDKPLSSPMKKEEEKNPKYDEPQQMDIFEFMKEKAGKKLPDDYSGKKATKSNSFSQRVSITH